MGVCCIILLFYIKPQPFSRVVYWVARCIILLFYIKPQLALARPLAGCSCIILLFYIKPQRRIWTRSFSAGCIILLFYIKPQPDSTRTFHTLVVSFFFSTSNHNPLVSPDCEISLYHSSFLHQTTTRTVKNLLESKLYHSSFLHQTTTLEAPDSNAIELYHSSFLHQTTTSVYSFVDRPGCIILLFYIKPQPAEKF